MRWSEQRRRVSADDSTRLVSVPPTPRSYRLSSRLTSLWRSTYQVVALAIVVMFVWPDIQNPDMRWTARVGVSYAAMVILGLFLMWHTDFRDVRLEGDDLVVSRLFRSWRFPAVLVTSVSQVPAASHRPFAHLVISVELGEPVPGLGRQFRFLPGSSSVPKEIVARVLLDASVQPYPRAVSTTPARDER